MDDSKIYGFDPIIFQDSKYLILGTLPGKKSLETKFYYADRGNCFWPVSYTHLEKQRERNMW